MKALPGAHSCLRQFLVFTCYTLPTTLWTRWSLAELSPDVVIQQVSRRLLIKVEFVARGPQRWEPCARRDSQKRTTGQDVEHVCG